MQSNVKLSLSEQDLEAFSQQLITAQPGPGLIFLRGGLGAGKTTLVRCLCQDLGVRSVVTSPSYQLLNSYECSRGSVVHVDLYRLSDSESLDDLCLEDYMSEAWLVFVEWPERFESILPQADILLDIEINDERRDYHLSARTTMGSQWLLALGS